MKIRIEDTAPDGMYIYIDSPIVVMTWHELVDFLVLFDAISHDPSDYELVKKEEKK